MVDFQSRDTTRGRTADDVRDGAATDDGSSHDEGASTDRPGDGSTADGPDRDESADERTDGVADSVAAAVVTVSVHRTHDDDPAGDAVVDAVESAGHDVVTREVLRPTHDSIQQTVDTLVKREDVDVVVTTGGVGVAQRDVTIEAVSALIDKSLPGFGERFRRLYADAVGNDAIATRATAGIAETTPLFCLPGDAAGARIAVDEIVVDQASRLVRLADCDDSTDP